MTAENAKLVAISFVSSLDLKGHCYEFAELRRHPRRSSDWAVVFDVTSPAGQPLDGPVIVLVDDITGVARLLDGE